MKFVKYCDFLKLKIKKNYINYNIYWNNLKFLALMKVRMENLGL